MPFANEFASEEDINKYDLVGLMDVYLPLYKGKQFELSPPMITIDRERKVIFMSYRRGREEYANRIYTLLSFDGQCVEVDIDRADGGSKKFEEVPFTVIWELARLRIPEGFSFSREIVIDILKEALTAYGYAGVLKQIPNTIVEFKF